MNATHLFMWIKSLLLKTETLCTTIQHIRYTICSKWETIPKNRCHWKHPPCSASYAGGSLSISLL